MLEIKTFLISPSKPTQDLGFDYSWSASLSEVISSLTLRPSACFIIDYSIKDHGFNFDKELFLSMAKEYSAVQGLAWRVNTGKELVLIDDKYKMISEKIEPENLYRDGLERIPLYYFSKESALHFIKEEGIKVSLGEHALPMALPKKSLDYKQKVPALFLDRDGVINLDLGYVHKHQDIEYLEEIFPIISLFNKRNWPVFVITNQSGVAQGKYSEKDVISLHKEMEADLLKEGLRIKEWVYSPYHFDKGLGDFKKHSFSRKPGSAMALLLLEKYAIDIENSFMIGDKETDNILLKGLNFLQLKGSYSFNEANSKCFDSLTEIQKYILDRIV
jgi:D-glycero-D-manno-heptose 1,7-bisphosphate phosphatase